ncbi:hypothetical protein I580_00903 [Enterococcus caccae ATCC BAA-1240]|uniref:Serine aminopeptidase S33 domain-containing protein n=2 Tax=Enterococcus caccae TaxID=317735 RepID=R3TS10_9ENTE|nr:hypothetical protein UC7_02408 [Enterococcus caccae ATCC BAA-1240]EOT68520.1 hypothetical protein I580_00903 [Enterococcus caccae ATCC BAA-1240]
MLQKSLKDFLKEVMDFKSLLGEWSFIQFRRSLFGEAVNCEVLIILGEQDEINDSKGMLENQKDFSKGVLILLENAGHNLQLDEREKVTNEISAFLESQ